MNLIIHFNALVKLITFITFIINIYIHALFSLGHIVFTTAMLKLGNKLFKVCMVRKGYCYDDERQTRIYLLFY